MKRWSSVLLAVAVSVGALAYALRGVQLDQLRDELVGGRYVYVLPSVLLIVLGLVLRGVRWQALLNGRIAVGHSFNILNVGQFFNNLLPLRLGEVVRAFLASRLDPPISMFTSLSSVVVERLTDVLAVVIFVVIAVAIAPVTPEIEAAAKVSGALAVIGMLLLAIFAARPALAHRLLDLVLRIAPFLERFHVRRLVDRTLEGIAPLGSVRGALTVFGWTAASWAASAAITYVLMFTFYDQPRWNAALLMTSIASLAIALPAVPGSVGPFEAAVVLGLTAGGMADPGSPEQQTRAVACAVLFHVVTVGSYAFLGMIGLSQERISLGEALRAARQLASRTKKSETGTAPANVE